MKKIKLLTIIGARPQFIKASVLSAYIRNNGYKYNNCIIEDIIVHTGQHYDDVMSEVFFNELKIPIPKYNIMVSKGSHGSMTGNMIKKLEKIILLESPDYIILYGDTNSTISGALAGVKLKI